MTEVLFNNINEFKKCMKTIEEEEGLLSKRDYILHDKFNNLDYNELNNYNSIEIIGRSKSKNNLYCFMYFVNNCVQKIVLCKYGALRVYITVILLINLLTYKVLR